VTTFAAAAAAACIDRKEDRARQTRYTEKCVQMTGREYGFEEPVRVREKRERFAFFGGF